MERTINLISGIANHPRPAVRRFARTVFAGQFTDDEIEDLATVLVTWAGRDVSNVPSPAADQTAPDLPAPPSADQRRVLREYVFSVLTDRLHEAEVQELQTWLLSLVDRALSGISSDPSGPPPHIRVWVDGEIRPSAAWRDIGAPV